MSTYRQSRLNEEIAKTLSEIIGKVKDRRISDVMLSITSVSAAPDLTTAKVFYSYLGKREKKDVQDGLVSASGYIRTMLASEMNMRHTPKLTFIYDDSFEHGAKIADLLRGVEKELREIDERNAAEQAQTEETDGESENE